MSSEAEERQRVAAAFTTTVEAVRPEAWDHPAPPAFIGGFPEGSGQARGAQAR